jgi:hypothetical protein
MRHSNHHHVETHRSNTVEEVASEARLRHRPTATLRPHPTYQALCGPIAATRVRSVAQQRGPTGAHWPWSQEALWRRPRAADLTVVKRHPSSISRPHARGWPAVSDPTTSRDVTRPRYWNQEHCDEYSLVA